MQYQYIKLFEEFISSDLKKIYLAIKRSSGHRWWTYKGFAGNKFFIQIDENNINTLDINSDYPILNYNSDTIKELLKNGSIKEENIYNTPTDINLSGSKEEFHKLVGDHKNVPKTVYSKDEAIKVLSFPIIAKPAHGHSGIGITIINNINEMNNIDEKNFDTYSEFIDKAEEMRFFTFKGKPIFWLERLPMNDKAKNGKGDTKEEMEFKYIKRNISELPKDYKNVLTEFSNIFKKLPYICFDAMKSKDGKVYVVESNAQPGVPFDSTVEIYKSIFEDFYKNPVNKESNNQLNDYAKEMVKMTLKKDNKRFSDKS